MLKMLTYHKKAFFVAKFEHLYTPHVHDWERRYIHYEIIFVLCQKKFVSLQFRNQIEKHG